MYVSCALPHDKQMNNKDFSIIFYLEIFSFWLVFQWIYKLCSLCMLYGLTSLTNYQLLLPKIINIINLY